MAKKNKNGKRVYEVSRRDLVKDFDAKLNRLWDLHHVLDGLLCEAEAIVENLESGSNRKEVQAEFEEVYSKFEQLFSDGVDATGDFGICIDNSVAVK
jgi:hypothetical protein